MTIEVRVPQLPESVADATLVSWHKKPGDSVVRDENLVDLETDKVVLEVPAPVAGVIKEIKLTDGTTVTSGQLLAVIEETARGRGTRRECSRDHGGCERRNGDGKGIGEGRVLPAASSVPRQSASRKKIELDPKTVAGSGRDGRVSKSDVVNYLSSKEGAAPKHRRQGRSGAIRAPGRRARQSSRAARADDAAARADRGAHGPGASHAGAVDLVQ